MTTTAATFDLDRVFAALAPIRKPNPPARPKSAVSAAIPLSAPSLDGTTLKEDDGEMNRTGSAGG